MKKNKRLKRRNRWFLAMLTTLFTTIAILLVKMTSQTTPNDFFHAVGTNLQTIPMIPSLANALPQGQMMIDTYKIEWVLIESAIILALIWLMYNRFQHHRKQHHKEEKARYVKNL